MSDRRPSNWLVVTVATGGRHSVSPTELLAVVRRGVESGTIKGEVVEAGGSDPGEGWIIPNVTEPGRYLVIPLSDGGEE